MALNVSSAHLLTCSLHVFFFHESNTNGNLSEMDESLILIEAIREASLPKFLPQDVPLFEKIIADIFPGAVVSTVNQVAFEVIRLLKTITDDFDEEY